ncbi:hypothetical protein [Acinetobacter haemolyticus]|uniref:hypothetical protein n=1 Tax=Acinetobacter haemolyticus TaxID=29430 RepID=UPI00148CE554|nr:hypothetical protein [Acinetobacter haemolyticus]
MLFKFPDPPLMIEQQNSYQIQPFLTANCIAIIPFSEQPIQANEMIYFMKID